MKESLRQEIDTTIRDNPGNLGYIEEVVTSAINAWHEKRLEDIPTDILVLIITISFDMGCQKRSTGNCMIASGTGIKQEPIAWDSKSTRVCNKYSDVHRNGTRLSYVWTLITIMSKAITSKTFDVRL